MKCKVRLLTAEAFAPYGTYFDVREGYGEGPVVFQADRMLQQIGIPMGSICSIRIKYRPLVLDETEYHEFCEEVFGGFECDVVFHVGILGREGKPDLDSIKAFYLPAGGFVRVKRRVLHHAGFVTKPDDVAHGLVLLSPSAYTVDCQVLNFDMPIQIEL